MAKRVPRIRTQAFLASLPMFSEMSPPELDRIAAGTSTLHVAKGEVIFRSGDPCNGMHLVVYGQVKLGVTSPQGDEKVVEIIRPGQSFGEALMFLGKPYIVSAQALTDSLLLQVAKEALLEELGPNPFGRRMLAGLAARLHGLVRDVQAHSLQSGRERVIALLLAEASQPPVDGADEVHLVPGKNVLASRLDMTPEHFSRILHGLEATGLIRVNGRSIGIPDVERLRAAPAAS